MNKDTRDQLEAFRKRQEEAEKAAKQDEGEGEQIKADTTWAVASRKRKKVKEQDSVGGVKIPRTSTAEVKSSMGGAALGTGSDDSSGNHKDAASALAGQEAVKPVNAAKLGADVAPKATKTTPPPAPTLGLGAYSSDEDD